MIIWERLKIDFMKLMIACKKVLIVKRPFIFLNKIISCCLQLRPRVAVIMVRSRLVPSLRIKVHAKFH